MAQVKPNRDYAVLDFQVGLGPKQVLVDLVLQTQEQIHHGLGEKLIVRLTPEMAKVLSRNLREASKAAAMGAAPTRTRQ